MIIMYVIIELIMFCVFVGAGGFPGFVIWVVLNSVGYYAHRLISVKEGELLLKAQKQEKDDNEEDES